MLLGSNAISASALAAIQQRRLPPRRLIQALQLQMQKRVISRALEQAGEPLSVPHFLQRLLSFNVVRNLPAWPIGYCWRRENVCTPPVAPPSQ